VSFEAARRVFDDAFALELFDFESQPGEIVDGVVLTVVYTEREERLRIISARKATKHEEREYYRSQTAE